DEPVLLATCARLRGGSHAGRPQHALPRSAGVVSQEPRAGAIAQAAQQATGPTVMQVFLRWFDARGDMRAVCLFRICAGPLVLVHLWPFASDALSGTYYRDSFY